MHSELTGMIENGPYARHLVTCVPTGFNLHTNLVRQLPLSSPYQQETRALFCWNETAGRQGSQIRRVWPRLGRDVRVFG